MSPYETIIVDKLDRIGWITFNRPEQLNAMNIQMEYDLVRAWRALEADAGVRVIVLMGQGRGFQVGVDLKQVAADGGMAGHQVAKRALFGDSPSPGFTPRATGVTKPVICAVNGVCAGAGFHFVMDSDITICSSDATFTEPHVRMGQVSALEPIGMVHMMPFGMVMRLALTGGSERLSAQRAFDVGLVTEVVDPPEKLREAAQALAEKIAASSPGAVALTKKAIWNALETGREHAMADGNLILRSFWNHPDNLEGARAFAEKREPRWA
jgi:enoyl-CoA hydratase